MFQQHKFESKFVGVPTIRITEEALHDMWCITDIVQKEVGWFCTVLNCGNNVFLIDGVYLPAQECSPVTTEITPAGEAKMMHEIMMAEAAAGVAATDPLHKMNRLDAWFHSHVEMSTSPSSQDLSEMEKFRATGRPYFIRGIVNKQKPAGMISLAFYDSRSSLTGFRVEDCPWEVLARSQPDPRRKALSDEIATKVKALGQPVTSGRLDAYSGFNGIGVSDGNWYTRNTLGNSKTPYTVPNRSPGWWKE